MIARRRHPDEPDFRPPGDPLEPVTRDSKPPVLSWVHGSAGRWAEHGIRVMSLAPGMVLNELWAYRAGEDDERVEARAGLRSGTSPRLTGSC
jgi:NAD(P)-dependent dehydrogenase (short-subunit alcohol dehydrogenase family)